MSDVKQVISELNAARLFFEMGSKRDGGVVGHLGCIGGMKYISDAIEFLKEQDQTIERLEHDLAVAENNLHYYINGND